MNRLFAKFATLSLLAIALGGCHLYVEDDVFYRCDEFGCYECDDYGCYPTVQGDGPNIPGTSCSSDNQCNNGTYCNDNGICEDSGFCLNDGDCGVGFDCDDVRNSCVPGGGGVSCQNDLGCDSGYCDAGTCQPSNNCNTDAQCSGSEICDDRGVCIPGGSILCQAELAPTGCVRAEPECEIGTTARIVNGCYTGGCVGNSTCADDNPCDSNTRTECEADSALGVCQLTFRGINCTSPNGQACDDPNAPDCSCESFIYRGCEDRL